MSRQPKLSGSTTDRHLWTDLSDRLKRREADVAVKQSFLKLEHTHVTAAVQKVAERTSAKEKTSSSDSAQPNKTATKVPMGGKGGKYGGGKDAGKWGTRAPRNPTHTTNDFWGSGGGNPTKGKGGGKPWGKDYGKFRDLGKDGAKATFQDRQANKRKVKEEK